MASAGSEDMPFLNANTADGAGGVSTQPNGTPLVQQESSSRTSPTIANSGAPQVTSCETMIAEVTKAVLDAFKKTDPNVSSSSVGQNA